MLVPTTDTVRYGYLMEKLLAVRHSVLFTGTTGVGKVGNTRRKRSAVKSEGTVELGSSAPEITHRFPAEIFRFHHFFKKKLSLQNLYRPGDFPQSLSVSGCILSWRHQPGFELRGISVPLQFSPVVWRETAQGNCVPGGLSYRPVDKGHSVLFLTYFNRPSHNSGVILIWVGRGGEENT